MLKKVLTSGVLVAALLGSSVGVARVAAQVRGDHAVYFTFSRPVALPKVTLPAGRYLFRLADSLTNRAIVEVYSADGAKLYAILMTIRSQRNDLPNDPEVRFIETAVDLPPAIGSYWYPGERLGWEFIYPRTEATKLVRAAKQPVLTTSADVTTTDEMRTAELVRLSPTGEQVPASTTVTVLSAPPAAGPVQRGEVATNPPVVTAATPVAHAPRPEAEAGARTHLPGTASATPLIALAGLVSLVAAFVLMTMRRQRVRA